MLYNFSGGIYGLGPSALVIDRTGNLYGTTGAGGNHGGDCREEGCGTVYELSHKSSGWVFSTLYSFHGDDGKNPYGVTIGPDGILYGAASGVTFSLRPPATACRTTSCDWIESILDTGGLYSVLTLDQSGNIYGTGGGGAYGQGAVYELAKMHGVWTQNVLYSFTGTPDGSGPSYDGVIFDQAGNIYSTTYAGGSDGRGTVFELQRVGNG